MAVANVLLHSLEDVYSSYSENRTTTISPLTHFSFPILEAGVCEVPEWQWLMSYSTALKTCTALTQRTELPPSFISLNNEAGQLENRNVLVSGVLSHLF